MDKAELVITAFSIIVGLLLMAKVATKPESFWQMLLAVTIITGGMVLRKVSYIDECLVACILVGFYVASSIRRVKLINNNNKKRSRLNKLHTIFFSGMVIYMFIESGRGIIISGSLRQIRWIVYYLLIGLISHVVQKQRHRFLSIRKTATTITLAGLVYFCLYLAVGILVTPIVDIEDPSRGIQNVYWGGTAYAAFPMVIIIPALFILLKEKSAELNRIAWLTFSVIVLASFYYDSRISWVCLLVFLVVSVRSMPLRRTIIYAVIFLSTIGFSFMFIFPDYYKPGGFLNILYKPLVFFLESPEPADTGFRDFGRASHIRVAFKTISSRPVIFLWGHGLRTSGNLLGPFLSQEFIRYGEYRQAFNYLNTTDIGTNGFTATVIETGLVGLILLLMNFYFVARRILEEKENPLRFIILTSLILTLFWFTITNPFDMVLFYLLLMPGGLLVRLSDSHRETGLYDSKYWNAQRASLSEIRQVV